jgi:hypothetical protein
VKKIISDNWTDVIDGLVKYREITTNTEEYDDADDILGMLNWFYKAKDESKDFRITTEKDMDNSQHKRPWYILRLVPNINTNREGVILLEDDY